MFQLAGGVHKHGQAQDIATDAAVGGAVSMCMHAISQILFLTDI